MQADYAPLSFEQTSPSLHGSLPNLPAEAIPELTGYFNESWGNKTRIDYGSGMELNFLCWMSVPALFASSPVPLSMS